MNMFVRAGYKTGVRLMLDDIAAIAAMWRKDAERMRLFAAAPDCTPIHKAELNAHAHSMDRCATLIEAAIRSAQIRGGE